MLMNVKDINLHASQHKTGTINKKYTSALEKKNLLGEKKQGNFSRTELYFSY